LAVSNGLPRKIDGTPGTEPKHHRDFVPLAKEFSQWLDCFAEAQNPCLFFFHSLALLKRGNYATLQPEPKFGPNQMLAFPFEERSSLPDSLAWGLVGPSSSLDMIIFYSDMAGEPGPRKAFYKTLVCLVIRSSFFSCAHFYFFHLQKSFEKLAQSFTQLHFILINHFLSLSPFTNLKYTVAMHQSQLLFWVAFFASNALAVPLNINLGAYSPALVVGDGEISFGGKADVTGLMNALEGAAVSGKHFHISVQPFRESRN
jgi:hypothetical protein